MPRPLGGVYGYLLIGGGEGGQFDTYVIILCMETYFCFFKSKIFKVVHKLVSSIWQEMSRFNIDMLILIQDSKALYFYTVILPSLCSLLFLMFT